MNDSHPTESVPHPFRNTGYAEKEVAKEEKKEQASFPPPEGRESEMTDYGVPRIKMTPEEKQIAAERFCKRAEERAKAVKVEKETPKGESTSHPQLKVVFTTREQNARKYDRTSSSGNKSLNSVNEYL